MQGGKAAVDGLHQLGQVDAPTLKALRKVARLGPSSFEHGCSQRAERVHGLDGLLLPARAARLAMRADRVGRTVKDRSHFVAALGSAVLKAALQRLVQLAKGRRRFICVPSRCPPDASYALSRVPPHRV